MLVFRMLTSVYQNLPPLNLGWANYSMWSMMANYVARKRQFLQFQAFLNREYYLTYRHYNDQKKRLQ